MPPATNNTNPAETNIPPKNILFYSEYLTNAKKQVKATEDLRNMLIDFADELACE